MTTVRIGFSALRNSETAVREGRKIAISSTSVFSGVIRGGSNPSSQCAIPSLQTPIIESRRSVFRFDNVLSASGTESLLHRTFISSSEGITGQSNLASVLGVPLIADKISSFGLVAISSSRAVMVIVFAWGTRLRTVPVRCRTGLRGVDAEIGRLFRLIHFRCFEVMGFKFVGCAVVAVGMICAGFTSGASGPLLLKIETLRRASSRGRHCEE